MEFRSFLVTKYATGREEEVKSREIRNCISHKTKLYFIENEAIYQRKIASFSVLNGFVFDGAAYSFFSRARTLYYIYPPIKWILTGARIKRRCMDGGIVVKNSFSIGELLMLTKCLIFCEHHAYLRLKAQWMNQSQAKNAIIQFSIIVVS